VKQHLAFVLSVPGRKPRLAGVGILSAAVAFILTWAHFRQQAFGAALTAAGHALRTGQPAALAAAAAVLLFLLWLVLPVPGSHRTEETS
jgi:hypothetical protein